MRRRLAAIAALVGMSVVAGAAQAALPPSTSPQTAAPPATPVSAEQKSLHDLLTKAIAELAAEKTAQGLADLDLLVQRPTFDELGAAERHLAWLELGSGRIAAQDPKAAEVALKRAVAFDQADQRDWRLLMYASMASGDTDGATTDLQTMARRWPTEVSRIDDRLVAGIILQSRYLRNGDARFFSVMSALEDAGWKTSDPFLDLSDEWVSFVQQLIAKGETAHAQRTAQRVVDPWALVRMQADKGFDVVTRADPDRFDVRAAAARYLAATKAAAAGMPDKLEGLIAVGRVLAYQGRTAEALSLFDDALARIRSAGSGAPPYNDLDPQMDWLLNERAWALLSIGHTEEGLAAMIRAAKPENGEPQISQVLNLAVVYGNLGRPRDALNTLEDAPLKEASPFGVSVAENARVCAVAQLKDSAALAKTVAESKARLAAVGSGFTESEYLCINDLDQAAAVDARVMESPTARSQFLRYVQDYSGSIVEVGPWAEELRKRRQQVVTRPELRSLITKYGRIAHYDLMAH